MTSSDRQAQNRKWVKTVEAAAEIGISPQHLRRLRADGLFQFGKHWINVRRANYVRPSYRWHVTNCIAALVELEKLEGKLLPKK